MQISGKASVKCESASSYQTCTEMIFWQAENQGVYGKQQVATD